MVHRARRPLPERSEMKRRGAPAATVLAALQGDWVQVDAVGVEEAEEGDEEGCVGGEVEGGDEEEVEEIVLLEGVIVPCE